MYFLVFRNAVYARAYQHRARMMFKVARKHMPRNITSPVLPTRGTIVDGEDVGQIVQDFTLVPSGTDTLDLSFVSQPYSKILSKLLASEGYEQITRPQDKTGRCVLLWVDGYQPSSGAIKAMLAKDGQSRGMPWSSLAHGQDAVRLLSSAADDNGSCSPGFSAATDDEDIDLEEEQIPRRQGRSWLIAFKDETEARRFARVWHLRPYSFPLKTEDRQRDEPSPLVHVEHLW